MKTTDKLKKEKSPAFKTSANLKKSESKRNVQKKEEANLPKSNLCTMQLSV